MAKRFPLFYLALILVFSTIPMLAARATSPAAVPEKPAFFPLKDLKPGMKAIGRTVFSGNRIEEFQVEILGVLENVGPRQSIILGRLSGGPLERTGVMAGMSGSPVYIDGKLVGAVALSFPFSKDPIAGITPIEQMAGVLERAPVKPPGPVRVSAESPTAALATAPPEPWNPREAMTRPVNLLPALPDESVMLSPDRPRLAHIGTPLVMSGFTPRTIEQFAPQFRALGLHPMQGGGGGSNAASSVMGDASDLQPGSMISVQLIRGDLGVNADGTVTYRDGNHIYAFGHRFLAAGPVEMPFAASNVITLLPNTANSFKISTPGKLLGAIRQDRSSGIGGTIGENPHLIPVNVRMQSSGSRDLEYHFEVVNDRFLSPFLLQIAVFGVIDATERLLGASSLGVKGTVNLDGLPPVHIENIFSADANAALMASQVSAVPLALLLQSGFAGVKVQGVDIEIASSDERRVANLDQLWSSRREVKPGEKIDVTAVLRAEDGTETVKRVPLEIPASVGPGPLQITVADGASLNMAEVRELPGNFAPKDPAQLVRAINKLRKNNRLYLRLSRAGTAFLLHGVQFPSPPPSLARTMANEPSASTNVATTQVSVLAEDELDPLPSMVMGQKTITITVKN